MVSGRIMAVGVGPTRIDSALEFLFSYILVFPFINISYNINFFSIGLLAPGHAVCFIYKKLLVKI
jgi:hypothetical protein